MKNKMQYLGSDNLFVFGVVLVLVVVAWIFTTWHDHETKKQLQETINNSANVIKLLQDNNNKLVVHSDSIILMSNEVTKTSDSLLETTKEQSIKLQKMAEMYVTKFNEAHVLKLDRDELARDLDSTKTANTKLKFENDQLLEDNQKLLNQLSDSLNRVSVLEVRRTNKSNKKS